VPRFWLTAAAALCCVFVVIAAPGMARAQAPRAVLLCEQLHDDKTMPGAGLELAATTALQTQGYRILELDSALRAQRFALADAVRSGQLPDELSVLNADLLVSLRMRCNTLSSSLIGTKVQAHQCVLEAKAIATTVGEVLTATSRSFTGHGLNRDMALQRVLDHSVPQAIETQARAWMADLTRAQQWQTELVVSGVTDHARARWIASELDTLAGVSAVRLAAYDRDVAKYLVEGNGAAERDQLAVVIGDRKDLALSITFEASRLLRAEVDMSRAFKQRVMVLAVATSKLLPPTVTKELSRAALMKLPYLDAAHTQPLVATPETEREREDKLRAYAQQHDIPLVFSVGVANVAGPVEGEGWLATLKLVDAPSGRSLEVTSGNGHTASAAIDMAAQAFDAGFREILAKPRLRARLAHREPSPEALTHGAQVVYSFQLKKPTEPAAGESVVAELEIENKSPSPIAQAQLTLTDGAKRVLSKRMLPTLAAARSLVMELPLRGANESRTDVGVADVIAQVTYPTPDGSQHVAASMRPRLTADKRKEADADGE